MENIFRPSIRLMNSLKFRRKMAVVLFIFSLPMSVFLYLLITEIRTEIDFASKEKIGVEYVKRLNKFLNDEQKHRGLESAFLGGAVTFKEHITVKDADIKADIQSIDQIDERFGALLQTTEHWKIFKEKLQQYHRTFADMNAKENFDAHTSIISDILSFNIYVADASNLTFDPSSKSHYLMTSMIEKLPRASEFAAQVRGLGVGAIARGDIDGKERARLSVLSGLFRSNMREAEIGLKKAFGEDPDLRIRLEANLEDVMKSAFFALDMLKTRVIHSDMIKITPEEYYYSFTEAIDNNLTLNEAVATSLESLLHERIDSLNRKLFYVVVLSTVSLLFVLYLFVGHYYSIMNALSPLVIASRRLGKGVFDNDIPVKTEDEMAEVTRSFNEMSRGLAEFTGKLKSANEDLENEISVRKHGEEVLRESRRSLSTLMSNLPGMAYRCLNDLDWTMKFVSDGAFELTGYRSLDLVDNREISYAELIDVRDRDDVWNDVQAALDSKKPFRLVYRIRDKSGRKKWVWEQGMGVYSGDGKLTALEGLIIDITERVNAVDALKESEERYRVIANTTSDAIITIRADDIITFVNPAIENIFGYKLSEVMGKSITMLMPERLRDKHTGAVKSYLKTGQRTTNWKAVELSGLHKDGHEIPVEISYGEFVEEGKNFFTGFIRDITDRKEAQKEKKYKNMLELFNMELESLVSERTKSLISLKLADRVRTPNVVIGWTANKLLKRSNVTDKFMKGLETIMEESKQLEATVKEFETALKSKQPVFHYEDINDIMESFIFIIEKEAADKDLNFIVNLSEQHLRINAQKDLLRMALFTLLRNAVESSPAGGTILLKTSGDIDNVCVTVCYTGAEIPKEDLDKIFEPAEGRKVYKFGMGLPLIKQIVADHLGEIKVVSEPEKGTTFSMVFPSKWMKLA